MSPFEPQPASPPPPRPFQFRRRTLLLLFLALGSALAVLAAVAFTVLRSSGKRGKLEFVEYDSTSKGGKQRMIVYTPPDYPHDAPYPVLYLLHGGGDDETSWDAKGGAGRLLDRLYARKQIAPMIAVMPNSQGRGSAFEHDLLDEVIPYIQANYATRSDRQGRAIAGCSLGGGQALSVGLKNIDRFAWVGGFSPALADRSVDDVIGNPAAWSGRLKLLWLSCGDRDRCRETSESLHRALEEKKIPHIWKLSSGGHDWSVWRDDLPLFIPLLFRSEPGDKELAKKRTADSPKRGAGRRHVDGGRELDQFGGQN